MNQWASSADRRKLSEQGKFRLSAAQLGHKSGNRTATVSNEIQTRPQVFCAPDTQSHLTELIDHSFTSSATSQKLLRVSSL